MFFYLGALFVTSYYQSTFTVSYERFVSKEAVSVAAFWGGGLSKCQCDRKLNHVKS